MLGLKEIEKEILTLPKKDYSNLRNWFYSRDFEKWDNKIKQDSESGKLDFLINEALAEKDQNELKRL
jgi:hypothetical protein